MSADDYVRKVVEKVAVCDDSDSLRISELLAQNVLFYGALLQREQGAIQFDMLLDLVGVQDPAVLQISLERVEQYMQVAGATSRQNPPFTFTRELMRAIQRQFYGANSLYRLDQTLPHIDLKGEDVIFTINRFTSNNPAQQIANSFGAILDVKVIPTRYPEFFIIEGTNDSPDNRAFIIAVIDDHSTLTQERYHNFLIQFINVIYDIDGSPWTLMVCPSVTGAIQDDINACRGIYAMWDLSIVRLLHLLDELPDAAKQQVKGDLSLLFARGIENSYSYMEGHVLAHIRQHVG